MTTEEPENPTRKDLIPLWLAWVFGLYIVWALFYLVLYG